MIPPGMLTTPIKLISLHILCKDIGAIQRYAFRSATMAGLEILTVESATFRQLSKTTLEGLESLTTLTFLTCSIGKFESGSFDILAKTLSILTLSQADPQTDILQAKLLTGSVQMTALHYAKFKYNMKNTITNETFVGVPMLTTLDLSNCKIETIGPNSFDRLSSLLMVRLNDNKLKNLPVGLFDRLLPNQVLLIDLTTNDWVCDCDICYVKTCLSNTHNFRGDKEVCPVSTSEETCIDETCFVAPATSPPAEPTPLVPLDPNAGFVVGSQQCQLEDSSTVVEIVKIRVRTQTLQIQENPDGTVILRVKNKSFNNTLLIWFDNGEHHFQSAMTSDDIDCRLNHITNNSLITRSIQLDNIKPNTPYTFCLMESNIKEYVVSPFNCVTYNKKVDNEQVWLVNNVRAFTIGMIVLSVSLTLLFGGMVGFIVMRRNPTWLRGGRNVVFVRSASDGSVLSGRAQSKGSSTEYDYNFKYLQANFDLPLLFQMASPCIRDQLNQHKQLCLHSSWSVTFRNRPAPVGTTAEASHRVSVLFANRVQSDSCIQYLRIFIAIAVL